MYQNPNKNPEEYELHLIIWTKYFGIDVKETEVDLERYNVYGYYLGRIIGHVIAEIGGGVFYATRSAFIGGGTLITAGSAGTLVIVGGIAVTVGGALVIGGASIGAVAAAGFGEDVGNFLKAATNGSEGAGDYYKKGLEKISDN